MRKLKATPVFNFTVSLLVLVFFTVFPLFFSGASASALEMTVDDFDVVYTSGNHPYCRAYRYGSRLSASVNGWSSYTNGDFSIVPSNATIAGYEQIRGINCGTANNSNLYVNVKAGDIASLYLRVTDVYPQQNNELYYVYSSIWKLSETDANSDFELDIVDIDEKVEWENNGRRIKLIKVTGIVQMDTTNPNFGITFGLGTPPSVMQQSAIDSIRTAIEPIEVQYFRPKERLDYTNQLDDILDAIESIDMSVQLDELKAQEKETTDAIKAQTRQQHDDYESEVEREENKQDELEDQADDVNISANAITNPFSSLFSSPNCASLPTLASWLNVSANNIQVCSPYPQQFRPIIEFVSSAIVVGLLIRVYYKQLKGGFAS